MKIEEKKFIVPVLQLCGAGISHFLSSLSFKLQTNPFFYLAFQPFLPLSELLDQLFPCLRAVRSSGYSSSLYFPSLWIR